MSLGRFNSRTVDRYFNRSKFRIWTGHFSLSWCEIFIIFKDYFEAFWNALKITPVKWRLKWNYTSFLFYPDLEQLDFKIKCSTVRFDLHLQCICYIRNLFVNPLILSLHSNHLLYSCSQLKISSNTKFIKSYNFANRKKFL